MTPIYRVLPLAAILAGVSILAACSSYSPQTGTVTGSYYRNAKVCLDQNNNGRCDSNEPATFTDDNGKFTLPSLHGSIVAEIGTNAVRFDPDTNTATPVTRPLVFRAPGGANVTVSAISTHLHALVDSGMDLKTAEAVLAARLGVSIDQLLEDHNKETDAKIKAILKNEIDQSLLRIAEAVSEAGTAGDLPRALRNRLALDRKIKNIVVIYAENRGFDNIYGLFPGANGLLDATGKLKSFEPQKDLDGVTILSTLPKTWGGMTAAGQTVTVTEAQSAGIPNKPFQIDDPLMTYGFSLSPSIITRDLVHRFYNNQMQIHGGKNDQFTAYADAGGLSMGYYDGSKMAMWNVAKQYTLADNFFMGTFGGSFLNHQYLICACAPEYPNADTSVAKNKIARIDTDANGNFLRLTPSPTTPTSAMLGPQTYLNDGAISPKDAAGKFYGINTMQPPYQPSGNAPATTDTSLLNADPNNPSTMPVLNATNIGDLLSAKSISWAWFGGAWNKAVADGQQVAGTPRTVIYSNPIQFQPHHQAFNYYANYAPGTDARNQHLKDGTDFITAITNGTLPAVSFYKPQGNLNQHPGYANVLDGDAHVADIINKLKASPQWANMLIVVTYDENGGFWDHVAPPKADRWGPGTRIPAIVISPYAKKGFVDHTQYDTASVLRLISHRFSLPTLPGLALRDISLVTSGGKPMGDLTNALDLDQIP